MKCSICQKEAFSPAVSVRLVARTESGGIADIHTNEHESEAILIPLCVYHFVLSGSGLIFSDGKEVMILNDVGVIEQHSDKQIKEVMAIIKKKNISKHIKDYNLNLAKAVLEARKIEKEMKNHARTNKD